MGQSKLDSHLRRDHPDQARPRPQCPECDKPFSSVSALNVHLLLHTGLKPFPCTWSGCPMSFARQGKLNIHHRTHNGELPYHCEWPDCGMKFKACNHLTRHYQTHTGEKTFLCFAPDCGKAFITSGRRDAHYRTHTKFKPYPCADPDCDRTFSEGGNAVTHYINIHTTEKPFACTWPECGRRFKLESVLNRHWKFHTGEIRIDCIWVGCDFSFSDSKDQKEHVKVCRRQHDIANGGVPCIDEEEIRRKPFHCLWFGCTERFSRATLRINHLHAVHTHFKRLVCKFEGCGEAFCSPGLRNKHYETCEHRFKPAARNRPPAVEPSTTILHPVQCVHCSLLVSFADLASHQENHCHPGQAGLLDDESSDADTDLEEPVATSTHQSPDCAPIQCHK